MSVLVYNSMYVIVNQKKKYLTQENMAYDSPGLALSLAWK